MRLPALLILCLALPGMAAAQTFAPPAEYDPALYRDAEAVARGRALYGEYCASCHGAGLEGQEDWQRPDPATGRRPAPPHDAEGHTWHHTDLQNWAVTKYGLSALVSGYESDMAGFGDILSDADILAILAYIKSTWPDQIIRRQDEMILLQ